MKILFMFLSMLLFIPNIVNASEQSSNGDILVLSPTHAGGAHKRHSLSPAQPALGTIVDRTVSEVADEKILRALVTQYVGRGLSVSDALTKAQQEINESKENKYEKGLRDLGCTNWSDVGKITPEILDTVRKMYQSKRGSFVLKPGLTIVYLNE